MFGLNLLGAGQASDGPCHFEDFVIGAGGQPKLVDGLLQKLLPFIIQGAKFFDLPVAHDVVGRRTAAGEPPLLERAGFEDALLDGLHGDAVVFEGLAQ